MGFCFDWGLSGFAQGRPLDEGSKFIVLVHHHASVVCQGAGLNEVHLVHDLVHGEEVILGGGEGPGERRTGGLMVRV